MRSAGEKGSGLYQGWVLLLLGLLVVLVYSYHIYFPLEPYFDEVHYVGFIRELFAGSYNQYVSNHPPLWHFLTALGMKIFGDHPWTWRLVSLMAGLGILPILYQLTKKISGDPLVALLAVFFWLFDCLSLTQARVCMMNSLQLLFMLVSMLFFLESLENTPFPDKKKLLFAGLFFGLAISTKLVALNMLLFFIPLLIFYVFTKKIRYQGLWPWLALCFLLIPFLIFFCVHLAIPFFKGRTIADIWNITAFHIHYHMTTTQTHHYTSPWWSWPIMSRPTWAFYKNHHGLVNGIIFIGNPVLFWSTPLSIGFVVWEFLKKRSMAAGIILLGFCSQWLFFSLATRMTFFHYFYLAMPFAAMAMALLARRVWLKGKIGRSVVLVFLTLTVMMFVYWYPLLTGLSIPYKFYEQHMWFRSWI